MTSHEFRQWLQGSDGFHATDPWNMRELYELMLDGEKIGDSDRFQICVLRLQALNRKAIVTWGPEPKWTDTFFEIGTNTTWYDDIEIQMMLSGYSMCNDFWIGTKFPTIEQIKLIRDTYHK